jgi:general secretion pathway protein F
MIWSWGLIGTGEAVFLALAAVLYVVVTRRRARMTLLVEHLAALAAKGLPLQSGLRTLGQDLGGFLGMRLESVARGIEDGGRLADGLDAHPHVFPPLLRAMVRLGEGTGNLAGALEELRRSYRRAMDTPATSAYFILYPVLLTSLVGGALVMIVTFFAPRMQELVESAMDAPPAYGLGWTALAWATGGVLAACGLVTGAVLFGAGSPCFGLSPLRWMKGLADRLVLATPVLGTLARQGALQQFAAAVGLVARAGGALPEAVAAAAASEPNTVLAERFRRMAKRLEEGERLGALIRADGFFSDDVAWFVETGERTGALGDHLLQAAAHLESKSALGRAVAGRAIVPVFVALNGALVLGAALLVFLPLRDVLRSVVPW